MYDPQVGVAEANAHRGTIRFEGPWLRRIYELPMRTGSMVLQAAKECGWVPRGTLPHIRCAGEAALTWPGSYCSPDFQRVMPGDAANLAAALETVADRLDAGDRGTLQAWDPRLLPPKTPQGNGARPLEVLAGQGANVRRLAAFLRDATETGVCLLIVPPPGHGLPDDVAIATRQGVVFARSEPAAVREALGWPVDAA